MRPLLALLLCVVATSAYAHPPTTTPTAARAPAPAPKNSLSVVGGVGKTYDDEGSLGRGLLLGAAYDRVLFGTTRADFSVELLTHDRDSGAFQSIGRTVIGGVSLLHRFGRGSVQPYAFGGLTAGHHVGTNTFATDRFPLSSTRTGTRFGFGIAFRGQHLEVSPELRMNGFFTGNDSDPWMMPSFGMRIGWRK